MVFFFMPFTARLPVVALGIILPLFLLVVAVLWIVVLFGGRQLEGLPAFCTQVGQQLEFFFHRCCGGLDGKFGWDGQQIETYLIEQMTVVQKGQDKGSHQRKKKAEEKPHADTDHTHPDQLIVP